MAGREVFTALRAIMAPYASRLTAVKDSEADFYLNGKHPDDKGKPRFFGAVVIKKSYVSYHLMPVYTNPQLLKNISPLLRKRMQGKSCFNFDTTDDGLFEELAKLTEAAFSEFKTTDKPRSSTK